VARHHRTVVFLDGCASDLRLLLSGDRCLSQGWPARHLAGDAEVPQRMFGNHVFQRDRSSDEFQRVPGHRAKSVRSISHRHGNCASALSHVLPATDRANQRHADGWTWPGSGRCNVYHLALLSVCNLRESHRFPTGLATAAQVLK
jgi:hypothetical protein